MSSLHRIPTQYSMHRADTGRFSSGLDTSDQDKGQLRRRVAQLQNIPKDLRDAFQATPGHVMIGGDWSAFQFALCMWFAAKVNEPNGFHAELLLQHQVGKFDAHGYLAAHFPEVGVPVEDHLRVKDEYPKERANAKGYTFGRMFYGSPIALARNCGHPDDLGREICRYHDEAFKLRPWWEATIDEVVARGYVETPAGWRRWFWQPPQKNPRTNEWAAPKPQEILATLIQATEADIAKYVLVEVYRDLPPTWEVVTYTHDSIILMVPEKDASEAAIWLRDKMEMDIPFMDNRGWIAGDCEIGPSWGDVT